MKLEIETIDRAKALEYLTLNIHTNRPISPSTVRRYAAEMEHGHWVVSHQGIAFDEAGQLIDGQHRLRAIVESGVAVPMSVTRNVPITQTSDGVELSTFAAIDRLQVRNVGHVLGLHHGYKDGKKVVAACNTILRLANPSALAASVPTVLAILKDYGAPVEAMLQASKQAWPKEMRISSIAGTLAFATLSHPDAVAEFAPQIFQGAELSTNSPAYALRFYSITTLARRKQGAGFALALSRATATAFKAFVEGRSLKKITENREAEQWLAGFQSERVAKLKRLSTFTQLHEEAESAA